MRIKWSTSTLLAGTESRLKRTNKRLAVLCNDCFILLKKESAKKYVLKNAVHIEACIVQDPQWERAFPDKAGEFPEYCFQILSPQKPFLFVAASQQEKIEWLEKLRITIERKLPSEIKAQSGWRHQIFQGTWHSAALTGAVEVAEGLLRFSKYHRKHGLDSSDVEESEGTRTKSVIPEASEDVLNCWIYDVNRKDEDGLSPLMIAAMKGTSDIASIMIEAGARVMETTSLGETPLHLCCLHGHEEIITSLVAHGTDINKKTMSGDTPLHSLLKMNAEEASMMVPIDDSQQIHPPGAKQMTHIELCFQTLLLGGRPPEFCARNRNGEAPMHIIAGSSHLNVLIPWLVRNGALVNDPFGEAQANPIHIACGHATVEEQKDVNTVLNPPIYRDTILTLLKFGAYPNKRTRGKKETPLHILLRVIFDWNMTKKQLKRQKKKDDATETSPDPKVEQALIQAALDVCSFGARLDLRDKSDVTCADLISKLDKMRDSPLHEHFQAAVKRFEDRKPPKNSRFDPEDVPGMESLCISPLGGERGSRSQSNKHISLSIRPPSNVIRERGMYNKTVPDNASEKCYMCDSSFKTLTRRKHHCRSCFSLCCDQCSQKRFPIKMPLEKGEIGYEKSRVCDACFNRLCIDAEDANAAIKLKGKEEVHEQKAPNPVSCSASSASSAKYTAASAASSEKKSSTEKAQYQSSEVRQQVDKTKEKVAERGEKINKMRKYHSLIVAHRDTSYSLFCNLEPQKTKPRNWLTRQTVLMTWQLNWQNNRRNDHLVGDFSSAP